VRSPRTMIGESIATLVSVNDDGLVDWCNAWPLLTLVRDTWRVDAIYDSADWDSNKTDLLSVRIVGKGSSASLVVCDDDDDDCDGIVYRREAIHAGLIQAGGAQ